MNTSMKMSWLWIPLVPEPVCSRAKSTFPPNKFLALTLAISVSASEETSFACSRAAHHPFPGAEKKQSLVSAVLATSAPSRVAHKMSQFRHLLKSLHLPLGSLVIKSLKNQARSRSKLVAVRSKDTSMKSVPLSSPLPDLVFSAGNDLGTWDKVIIMKLTDNYCQIACVAKRLRALVFDCSVK